MPFENNIELIKNTILLNAMLRLQFLFQRQQLNIFIRIIPNVKVQILNGHNLNSFNVCYKDNR